MDDKDVIGMIITAVESCDEFHYMVKNIAEPELDCDISFTAYCHRSQRYQCARQFNRQRYDPRLPTFNCGGIVKGKILRERGCIQLLVMHSEHRRIDSERETLRQDVPVEAREYIAARSNTLDAVDLYDDVVAHFPNSDITRMQVYYWWNKSFQHQYRLNDDQVLSCRALLERHNANGFNEVCTSVEY